MELISSSVTAESSNTTFLSWRTLLLWFIFLRTSQCNNQVPRLVKFTCTILLSKFTCSILHLQIRWFYILLQASFMKMCVPHQRWTHQLSPTAVLTLLANTDILIEAVGIHAHCRIYCSTTFAWCIIRSKPPNSFKVFNHMCFELPDSRTLP
jgi:hypothetical protein